MSAWDLPRTVILGGQAYAISTDFRDILEIMGYLTDPDQPEWVRWHLAVSLFYEEEIPPVLYEEAMERMVSFIGEGEQPDGRPHPRLLDWEQDALPIVADINKVAGTEVRALPYLHWWTFLSYFRAIGEGQLSTIVSIRDKLSRHKKLEKWEQEYYREHKAQVDLKKRESAQDREQKDRILKMLDG